MQAPETQWHVKRRGPQVLAGAGVLLVLAVILAAGMGTVHIGPGIVARIIANHFGLGKAVTWPQAWETIILQVRLPRVLLGAVVGVALGLAGTILQGLFQNPLADPYIVGVSSGANLGQVLGLTLLAGRFGLSTLTTLPLMAFLGGFLAVVLVWRLASVGARIPVISLLLAGVSVSSVCGAMVMVLQIFNLNDAAKIILMLMGGLGGATWTQVGMLLPYVAIGAAVLMLFRQELNAMLLGEETAQHLGVGVQRMRLVLLVVATLLTAAAVAFAGPIGFVGLIVPHVVRFLVGPDHRYVLPVSALGGGLVLVLADTVGRLGTQEIPAGAVMALVGGPFFLWMLRRHSRHLTRGNRP